MNRVALRAVAVLLVLCVGLAASGSPAAAQAPPVGPQVGGRASCTGSLASTTLAASSSFGAAGSGLILRCYGPVQEEVDQPPWGGGTLVAIRRADNGNYNGVNGVGTDQACFYGTATRPELGRYELRCTALTTWSNVRVYSGFKVDWNTFSPSPYPGGDNPGGLPPTISGAGNSTPVAWSFTTNGTFEELAPPEWPTWWPVGVEEVDYGDNTALPRVRCWYELREGLDGSTVYGDFRAQVMGSTPTAATDEYEWAYEWDDERDPRGEVRSSSWWVDRDTVPGRVQLGVPVPTSDVPGSGWQVGVRLRRTYEGLVHTETTQSTFEPVDVDGGMVVLGGVTTYAAGGYTEQPEVAEGVYQLGEAEVLSAQVIAWQEVTVPCSMTVDPETAGTPSGSGVSETGPRHGPGSGETDDGEPGGSDDCARPEGWGTLNPIGWAGYGLCELGGSVGDLLGELLDAIGDLLSALGSLADDILDGLLGLLVPDDPWSDRMESMSVALDESGAGDLIGGVESIGTGFGDAFEVAGSGELGCEGPEVPYPVPDGSGGYDIEDERVFDSCEGLLAGVRGFSNVFVAGVFGFGAFVGCYNMLARRVGWDTIGGDGEKSGEE